MAEDRYASLARWHLRTWRLSRHAAAGPARPPDLSLGLAEGLYMGESAKHQQAALARKKARPNQFLVLVYNLLLADLHQAASFLLNAVWVGRDGIHIRTATCWAQAFLIQIGDLASSFFITAIAVHTYLAVVWNYTPPQSAIYIAVVFLWIFNYLLIIIGIAVTDNGKDVGGFFVRATAWCWINVRYEKLRLYLHYLWIFIALALTGILYTLIFLSLHKKHRARRSNNLSSAAGVGATGAATESRTNIHDADDITTATTIAQTRPGGDGGGGSEDGRDDGVEDRGGGHPKVFLLYPLIYILCTAPLALGRIATMAGVQVPVSYFCVAGALITSNGWLDVLLWGVTRHRLLFGSDVDVEDSGLDTFTFMRTPHGRQLGNMVWVEGGRNNGRRGGEGGGDGAGMEGEAGKLGGLVKRRMGWRPLFGFGGGGGGGSSAGQGEGRGGGEGQSAPELAGREDGLAIQMDMVTTVVVEPAEGKEWEPGRARHAPSASAGSNNRAYEDLELDDTLLKSLQ
ncbi:hypothetical protein P885DRAFT_66337 [Corynascus similis CBS 632.67]